MGAHQKYRLRTGYRAVIKALIVFYGLKHAHVAAVIGMRSDTFSKWFTIGSRSLSVEELKLFCDGCRIPGKLVENLVEVSLNHCSNGYSLSDYLSSLSRSDEAKTIETHMGKEAWLRILPVIFDYYREGKSVIAGYMDFTASQEVLPDKGE